MNRLLLSTLCLIPLVVSCASPGKQLEVMQPELHRTPPAWTSETPIGTIVAERPQTARIFELVGIDYCCGGQMPVGKAAAQLNIDSMALLRALDVAITPPIATAVFLTLVCDTGWFRHPNTTADTMRFAAELLEAGADRDTVHAALFHQDSLPKQKLLGKVLDQVESACHGQLVWSHVTRRMAKRLGCGLGEAEGFIDRIRGVKGAGLAMLLKEVEPKVIRVSLRARPGYSALAIAKALGGGGHELAAGATVRGATVDQVAFRVIALIEDGNGVPAATA